MACQNGATILERFEPIVRRAGFLNNFLMPLSWVLIRLCGWMRYTVSSKPGLRWQQWPTVRPVPVRDLLAHEIHSHEIPCF